MVPPLLPRLLAQYSNHLPRTFPLPRLLVAASIIHLPAVPENWFPRFKIHIAIQPLATFYTQAFLLSQSFPRRHTTEVKLYSPHDTYINMSKTTMKAVVFKGTLDVKIEDRPIPKIIDQTDIIIKVNYSALCGRCDRRHPKSLHVRTNPSRSELHVFRGHQPSKTDFIMVRLARERNDFIF